VAKNIIIVCDHDIEKTYLEVSQVFPQK